MPTIFDKYEIHFDGNNLWCDYPIIIGVNGTNTTKLIFDAEAGIESFMLNTRTGGALAYEPVNDVVTVNPPASYAGEDYDCLVMLGAGNYHLQVSIVETPYFHDEDTEEQAQANAGEITTIKGQVAAIQQKDTEQDGKIGALESTTAGTTETVNTLQENFNTLNDSVGNLRQAVASVLDILSSGAGAHNSVYRGKNLGSNVTAEQYAAIASGTFDDLYIGDYWTIGGVTYRIAAFDYYLQTGDTPCTDHHATIVPDSGMYGAAMNDTNATDGGYYGSKLRTSGLDTAKATISSAFGADHILTHRQLLSNAVSNGAISGWAWYDSQIELMNEHMAYGAYAWGGGVQGGYNAGVDKSQLPLFRARPDLISSEENCWARDVGSGTEFAYIGSSGSAGAMSASTSFGVRPAFSIIG